MIVAHLTELLAVHGTVALAQETTVAELLAVHLIAAETNVTVLLAVHLIAAQETLVAELLAAYEMVGLEQLTVFPCLHCLSVVTRAGTKDLTVIEGSPLG